MKTYVISLLVMVFGATGFAQTKTVEGKVLDGDIPLENVAVVFYNQKQEKGTSTNKKGLFEIDLSEGDYTMETRMLGYITDRKKIQVKKGSTAWYDIHLKEDVLGIDEVVVTATKTEQNRKEAVVLVNVTDAKVLKNVKASTLMEGLVFQPGLRTEVNCQNCGFSQVRINGLEGAYSQILINSRPVFGSLNGIYGLEQIPTNMIQQIEVIRGGGSALFGSNAIAGTINIITKNPTSDEFQVGTTYNLVGGKAGDFVTTFNGSLVSEDYNKGISVYGMHRKREHYDANSDGFSELTDLNTTNFGLKLFNEFTARKKWDAELNFGNEKRRGGSHFELPEHLADIAESIESKVIGGQMNYQYVNNTYTHKFSGYSSVQLSSSDNYYGVGKDPEGYGITKENILLLGMQHTAFFTVGKGKLQLTSGAEFKNDDVSENRLRTSVLSVQQNASTLGVFTQADWKIRSNFKILAGLRAENVTANLLPKSLMIINPRASILYNITENFIFRASYARGFRAPLFYSEDIHSEMIPGEVRRVRLADNLKEETSDSFLASLEYNHSHQGHQMIVMLEGFYTQLHNPFVYEDVGKEAGLAVREKQNGDQATVSGVNVELKYSPSPKFIFQLGGTLQTGKYKSDYEPEEGIVTNRILRTPNLYSNFIVTYQPSDSWTFNATGVYTGEMEIPHLEGYIAENRLETTPDLMDVGLNAVYRFENTNFYDIDLTFGLKNIFNQYQKDFDRGINRNPAYIYGPPIPRTFFAGITMKM